MTPPRVRLAVVGALGSAGHEVVIVSRCMDKRVAGARTVPWDGRTAGEWMAEVDGVDAVINLAGRSVNCRSPSPLVVTFRRRLSARPTR